MVTTRRWHSIAPLRQPREVTALPGSDMTLNPRDMSRSIARRRRRLSPDYDLYTLAKLDLHELHTRRSQRGPSRILTALRRQFLPHTSVVHRGGASGCGSFLRSARCLTSASSDQISLALATSRLRSSRIRTSSVLWRRNSPLQTLWPGSRITPHYDRLPAMRGDMGQPYALLSRLICTFFIFLRSCPVCARI